MHWSSANGNLLFTDILLISSFWNKTQCDHSWKEKTESLTCCPGEVCCFYKEQKISKYFIKKVTRQKKHPNFEFDIITTTVANIEAKCKVVDII